MTKRKRTIYKKKNYSPHSFVRKGGRPTLIVNVPEGTVRISQNQHHGMTQFFPNNASRTIFNIDIPQMANAAKFEALLKTEEMDDALRRLIDEARKSEDRINEIPAYDELVRLVKAAPQMDDE